MALCAYVLGKDLRAGVPLDGHASHLQHMCDSNMLIRASEDKKSEKSRSETLTDKKHLMGGSTIYDDGYIQICHYCSSLCVSTFTL